MNTKFIYVMGSASGIGKSTVCAGILSQCLRSGYQAAQLAYIKPMTQCTEKQAVTVFCEQLNIQHQSIATQVFDKSFTKNFIDGGARSSAKLLQQMVAEIVQLSIYKKIVLVDGMGGPSTGSVVGVSNVDVAKAISAAVLFVGKGGIGAAIDDTVLGLNFIQQHGIENIALLYNQIEADKLQQIKYYLSRRLTELFPALPVLDFIIKQQQLEHTIKFDNAAQVMRWIEHV